MIRLDITSDDTNMSITECILYLMPEMSRYNLKKMLKGGEIRLNGYTAKKDYCVAEGDVIEIYAPIEFERGAVMDVCYEDKNIIILNKQPGTQVIGDKSMRSPDLLTLVTRYMRETGEFSEQLGCVPFACQTLDMYTGGLVMFVKNADIFETLRQAISQRRVKRVFKAVVKGCPKEGTGQFQHFYSRDGKSGFKVFSKKSPNAIPVFTKYRVINSNGNFSLVNIEPVTQLAEQERAHMGVAGYPIIGDQIYGDRRLNKKLGIYHQALWACAIEFTTGVNNMLEYLNGKQVYTEDIIFPMIDL